MMETGEVLYAPEKCLEELGPITDTREKGRRQQDGGVARSSDEGE